MVNGRNLSRRRFSVDGAIVATSDPNSIKALREWPRLE
jgi:hypothetical protein